MEIIEIAAVCHEANRAYCKGLGDNSQPAWDEAPEWQKSSAVDGVKFRQENPNAPDSASHDRWFDHKKADGWTYGAVKDPERKTHPCMVPFRDPPPEQQRKDRLFGAIVGALS